LNLLAGSLRNCSRCAFHEASGTSANRPEFQRLFRDAAERRSDLLPFWALDRFSREGVVGTLQHLERLRMAFSGEASRKNL
jgi:DNA invertase Pin-like site-specific DNA recombinase